MIDIWEATVQRAQDAELPKQGKGASMSVAMPGDELVGIEPMVENNMLYPVYYVVLDAENTGVVQRGVAQKTEFDHMKADGVNIHETDGWGSIINE